MRLLFFCKADWCRIKIRKRQTGKEQEEQQGILWQCVSSLEYLLLIQHEIGEASSTEGLDVFWVLLQNGTEVKDGDLSLAQQDVAPASFQQGVCCLTTLKSTIT